MVELLKQGSDPRALALSLAVGAALGVFPIPIATVLCVIAGGAFRLNHVALQTANYAVYPLQIPGVVFFVAMGDRIFGAPSLPFSVDEFKAALAGGWLEAFDRFGAAALHGVTAWAVIAPPSAAVVFALAYWWLRRRQLREPA